MDSNQNNWSFSQAAEWKQNYSKCSNNIQQKSPVNIDTNDISQCHALCRLALRYVKTNCYVSYHNNIPTVRFDPGSILKFKNEFFYLKRMTIHHTSMHTVNKNEYDLEVMLYHSKNPITEADGGVLLCILFKSGSDKGKVNHFFNQFINQIPAEEHKKDIEVEVDTTWTPEIIIPKSKSFFYYDGGLPYPPCDNNWKIVIFEEVLPISKNIVKTIQYILGKGITNNRPIQEKHRECIVFYNSYDKFTDTINKEDITETPEDTRRKEEAELDTMELELSKSRGFFAENKIFMKGLILVINLIIMIYIAVKFAKYLITKDVINDFIVRQVEKKTQRNEEKKRAEAEAQGMDPNTGAPLQVEGMPQNIQMGPPPTNTNANINSLLKNLEKGK
tara:strand:+ start:318 stop:1484 length:1167 start_codon:yes stop_codon:yes gene_type:complete